MKYRKFTKQEQKENRVKKLEKALHGEGIYIFRNNTNADLTLPRPTKSGIRIIRAGKEFQGDNYYMQLVKKGILRLVKQIQAPESNSQKTNVVVNESNNQEVSSMEEKLILDQPDTVTNEGKVEHIISEPKQKINETQDGEPQSDVLLNEGPIEDGFVIVKK